MAKELTELFQKRQAAQAENRRAHSAIYRSLLSRHDKLSSDDESQLLAAMEHLGLTEADVIGDAEAIKRTAELTPIVATVDQRQADIYSTRKAVQDHAEAERAMLVEGDKKRAELTLAANRAQSLYSRTQDAIGELAGIKQKRPHLF